MANVVDRIMDVAARSGPENWLILRAEQSREDQCIPYRALLQQALRWSALYRSRGLASGSRVLISLPLGLDLLAAHLGALLIGSVPAIFTFPTFKLSFVRYASSLSEVCAIGAYRAAVLDPSIVGAVQLGNAEVLTRDALGSAMDESAVERRIDPAATAIHQYSSGTTGLKKGLPLSHAQLTGFVDAYAQAIRLDVAGDRIASWLPLYHDMGFIACWMLPLLTGCPLYSMSAQDWVKAPRLLADAIARYRCSLLWLPNFAFSLMQKTTRGDHDLSSLRVVVNSSEVIRANSVDGFSDHFAGSGLAPSALAGCYGMAENTYAVTQTDPGEGLRQIHADRAALDEGRIVRRFTDYPGAVPFVSSGRPVDATNVLIESNGEAHRDENRVGEVLLSGPYRFDRYDKRSPEGSGIDAAGRFRTGDLGFLHGGELFVMGRKDDVIVHAGKNIFPEDIEDAASAVTGVVPGRVVAFGVSTEASGTQDIVVLAETKDEDPPAVAGLKARLAEAIAQSIDAPVGAIELVPHMTLLKSTSGKISRRQNRAAYADGALRALKAEPGSLRRSWIGAVASGVRRRLALPVPEMTPRQKTIAGCIETVLRTKSGSTRIELFKDTSVVKSGLIDSLSIAILLLELERAFSIAIPLEEVGDIEDFDSISSIEEWLGRRSGAKPKVPARKSPKLDLNFRAPGVRQFGERVLPEAEIRAANQWFLDLRGLSSMPPASRDHIEGTGFVNASGYSSQTITTDNHGFRSTLIAGRRVTVEEFRELPGPLGFVSGASASFGSGTSADRHCFPNVLNAISTRISWFNASLRSANFKAEASVLKHYADFPALRHVLMFSGANEYWYFTEALTAEERSAGAPHSRQAIDERYLAFLEEYESDLRRIQAWVAQRGVKLRFVLQPIVPFTKAQMTDVDAFHAGNMRALMGRRVFANNFTAGKYIWLLRDRFQDDAQKISARLDIPYLNPARSKAFGEVDGIFVDYWHYNDRGHAILAREIADFVTGT